MDGQMNDKVIADLGEVKGLLRGVTEMIQHSEASTHRRIDDLTQSINRRMDATDLRMREVGQKADAAMDLATNVSARVNKNSAVFGASAGALIGAGIQLIKMLWYHH